MSRKVTTVLAVLIALLLYGSCLAHMAFFPAMSMGFSFAHPSNSNPHIAPARETGIDTTGGLWIIERENPTTGFQWAVSEQPAGVVSTNQCFYIGDGGSSFRNGTGGTSYWHYLGEQPGTTTLTYLLSRGADETISGFTVTITVADNLRITNYEITPIDTYALTVETD